MTHKEVLMIMSNMCGYDPMDMVEDLCKFQTQKQYVAHLEEEVGSLRKLNNQISSDIVNLRNENITLQKVHHEKVTALESRIAELSKKTNENKSHEEFVDDYIKRFEEANASLHNQLTDLKKKHVKLLIDYRRLSRKAQEYLEREKELIEKAEEWEFTADGLREDLDNAVSEKDFYISKWEELKETNKKQQEHIEKQDSTLAAAAKHIRKLETMIEKYKELQSLYESLLSKSKEIDS